MSWRRFKPLILAKRKNRASANAVPLWRDGFAIMAVPSMGVEGKVCLLYVKGKRFSRLRRRVSREFCVYLPPNKYIQAT